MGSVSREFQPEWRLELCPKVLKWQWPLDHCPKSHNWECLMEYNLQECMPSPMAREQRTIKVSLIVLNPRARRRQKSQRKRIWGLLSDVHNAHTLQFPMLLTRPTPSVLGLAWGKK